MVGREDWMRMWGLDPKTGLPLVWQFWWQLVKPWSSYQLKVGLKISNDEPEVFKKNLVQVTELKAAAVTVEDAQVEALPIKQVVKKEPLSSKTATKRQTKVAQQGDLNLETVSLKTDVANKPKRAPRQKKMAVAISQLNDSPVTAKPETDVPKVVAKTESASKSQVIPAMEPLVKEEVVVKSAVKDAQKAAQKVVAEFQQNASDQIIF